MNKYEEKYVGCPVCNSQRIAQYHKDFRDNTIYKCRDCTVQFMNPVYTDGYLADFYAKYYGGEHDENKVAAGHLRTNKIKFGIISRYVEKPGKLLDFGCGMGNFLEYAKTSGWDVIGYDVDCDVTGEVAERLGVTVKCGDFSKIDMVEESFDLVHAHHVVEHLKYPLRDLKIIYKLLKNNGIFYLGVPNIYALSSRLKYWQEKAGLRRRNIGKYYDSDHHIFYYSPGSITNLLHNAGFEVLLIMNGSKSHISDSPWKQFISYRLMNYLYANSAMLIIARKR